MEEMRQMQVQQQQMAMEQARQAQAKQTAIEQAYRGALRTPDQMAMAKHGGPTVAAAGAAQGMAPGLDQNALIQGLMQADPMAAAQMLQPKPRKLTSVAPGASLVDESDPTKALFTAPKESELPSSVREFQYGLANPAYNEWNLKNNAAKGTRVQVDAGQRFENAYSTAQGKEYSEMMAGINKAGFQAPAQIRKLERMTELLDGVDGGKLAPTGLEIASALNSFGVKVDPRLGNKEAAQALSRELAGGLRQPGSGPMTDKDFENFLQQIPDLSKSAQGRKQISTTMKAALNRDIQISKMAREYERRHGRLDGGFMDEVASYIAENPVVAAPGNWVVNRGAR
jgi:hypothetical protein